MRDPSQGLVLVTGASGFVGRALVAELHNRGVGVRRVLRGTNISVKQNLDDVLVEPFDGSSDFSSAFDGSVDVVIHLAARVHIMGEDATDSYDAYRKINIDCTARLAEQAALSGVRRFIFVSSIKVNGEYTLNDQCFSADSPPQPHGSYAASKWEAEKALHDIANASGMEVVVIRPPLIYGAGVKANFRSIMRLLANRIPLPLGGINENRRSLVALDNLVDLLVTCLSHPAAANQTFLVSDGEDLSTSELLLRMGLALGKPALLFCVPTALLKFGAVLLGRHKVYERLSGSLQLDISKTQQLLNWTPPVSVDEGLRRAAQGFINETLV